MERAKIENNFFITVYSCKLNIREKVAVSEFTIVVRALCRIFTAHIDRLFNRSAGTTSSAKRVHIVQQSTPRAAYAPVFFRNADDNKDNNSILLSTFALSPLFFRKTFSGVTVPPSDPHAT